jgi:hypothetical protein
VCVIQAGRHASWTHRMFSRMLNFFIHAVKFSWVIFLLFFYFKKQNRDWRERILPSNVENVYFRRQIGNLFNHVAFFKNKKLASFLPVRYAPEMWHEPVPTVCHIDLLDYINKLIWNRKMFYNTFCNNWNLITPPKQAIGDHRSMSSVQCSNQWTWDFQVHWTNFWTDCRA